MKCPACGCDNIDGVDECAECQASLHHLNQVNNACAASSRLHTEPLRNLAVRTPIQLGPETTVRDAVQQLVDSGRHCALVTEHGRVRGIFTERDVLSKIARDYHRLADRPVREFMTPRPETLQPGDSVAFGLNRMTVGGFRHIPLEENGVPAGVVSVRDVLRYLADCYPDLCGAEPQA